MNGLTLRVGAVDRRIFHAVAHRRRWVTLALRAATHLGDPPVIALVAVLLLAGTVPGAGHGALALILSHLLSQLLKRAVSRSRPTLPVGVASLIEAPDRFSFPSAHASATLSVALPLFLGLPIAVGGPVLALALAVGLARCYLGVHYPGDVVVGWALGTASVILTGSLLS